MGVCWIHAVVALMRPMDLSFSEGFLGCGVQKVVQKLWRGKRDCVEKARSKSRKAGRVKAAMRGPQAYIQNGPTGDSSPQLPFVPNPSNGSLQPLYDIDAQCSMGGLPKYPILLLKIGAQD